MPRLRLAFLGTPEFAVASLAVLIDAGHDIAAVYCQPPRPAGRGRRLRACPVQALAERHGLAVRVPASLGDGREHALFRDLRLDAAAVVAYGLLLPPAMLTAPRLGCLNLHASLLPRWRGAAPIQHALLAGDAETGVTIMQMDAGLDTGAILLSERSAIEAGDTGAALSARLAGLGASLLVAALDGVAAGWLTPRTQPAEGITYAPKLSREDGRLDWRRPAAELERQVRALDPWPGAWFELAGQRVRVLSAAVDGAAAGPAGRVRPGSLEVACGDGTALELNRVQKAGRRPLDAAEFLRGQRHSADFVLP